MNAITVIRKAARLAAGLVAATYAAGLAAGQLIVVQEKAPMFKEPNISSPIIKYLEKEARVNLLAAEDSFYLVSFGGFEGWVIPYSVRETGEDSVERSAQQPEAKAGRPEQRKSQPDLASGRYLVVTNRYANVREGPGLGYKIIGKAYQGDLLEKFIRRGDWYRVKLPDSRVGFIFHELVGEPPEAGKVSAAGAESAAPAVNDDCAERVAKLEKEVGELREALRKLQAAAIESAGKSGAGSETYLLPGFRNAQAPTGQKVIIGNRVTRVYHLPESVYYNKIPEEFRVIFNSEEEARKAGYTKSIK